MESKSLRSFSINALLEVPNIHTMIMCGAGAQPALLKNLKEEKYSEGSRLLAITPVPSKTYKMLNIAENLLKHAKDGARFPPGAPEEEPTPMGSPLVRARVRTC